MHLNQVNFREGFVIPGFLDVKYGYNVLVIKVPQKLHLSQRS